MAVVVNVNTVLQTSNREVEYYATSQPMDAAGNVAPETYLKVYVGSCSPPSRQCRRVSLGRRR
eukprot:66451-Pyramimonas_sp.AAC.1